MIKQLINSSLKVHWINASSMTNAIFVCLIISVFCGCLVLTSYYNSVINNQLYAQEELIDRNNASFNYLIGNVESIPYEQTEHIDVFDEGISTIVEKKHWGFYDILICKTGFKNDTISKIVLVGQKSNNCENLALYVTDYDKPLKLSGETRIFGKIKIPLGHTQQAYLNGQKGNTIKLKGQQLKSGDRLPKIDKSVEVNTFGITSVFSNVIGKNSAIVNSFDKATKILDLTDIKELSDITCKGNIVLTSKGKLKITDSAKLNDVIVYATEVEIQSGFSGNVQIVAKEKVVIQERVSLLYPSSIYIKNDLDSTSVIISKNATVVGGIVVDGNSHTGTLNRFLDINENATVVGNVYCYGKTQLVGTVIGSVFTDTFFLKTKSSSYENVILNGTINIDSLPKDFIGLPLFKNDSNKSEYAVIKQF